MEFIHTLLSFVASLIAGGMLFVTGILASYQSTTPPISIAPPAEMHAASTTPAAATSTPTIKTSSTAQKPAAKPPAGTKTVATAASQASAPQTSQPAPPTIDPVALNTDTRAALVNILCLSGGGGVHSISASGVFVDSRGVILTNAHVGQFFLLKDYPTPDNVRCTVRTGSPAQSAYYATLLYLPPAWITANAAQITSTQAVGTGENDYAFLLVTGSASGTSLPAAFPALPMTSDEPSQGENMLLAGYPAGFLDGFTIEQNLYISSAFANVTQLYTYGTGQDIDLVSIGGTIVSQGGASGGAAVRASDGTLQGIIATATTADTTAGRDLRAVTLAHINRSLNASGVGGVAALLSGNVAAESAQFNAAIAPSEKAALVNAIQASN
ncbi:MAG TPA: trypsin-like peptidase domain-containing protein [Candidatus Paceibacterota bacterium]|nr:trypsin-like peptidase domain-containing protein [Candidatus Paceibacterota bacterium]